VVSPQAVPVVTSTSSVVTTKEDVGTMVKNAVATGLFASASPNTDQNILAGEQQMIQRDIKKAGYETYPASITASYVPTVINEDVAITPRLPQDVSFLTNILEWISKFLFIDLFPLIGIVGLYIALRRRPSAGNYDLILMGVGSFILIALTILVPYIQEYYNFTRLYLQMFMVLSTFAVLGGVMVTKYLPRYQVGVLTLMAVIIFCALSGALDQFTGGQRSMVLDQPPANLDGPYVYDGEVASAQWLSTNRNDSDPIQADIVANLRLQSFGNMSAENFDLFPQTLQPESYVYLTKENIAGEAFYQYQNDLLTYNYPLDFLNQNKNLIYSDGDSRVYQ